MPYYKASGLSAAAGIGVAIGAARASTNMRLYLRELTFTNTAATVAQIGLIASATLGTVSTEIVGQAVDTADINALSGRLVTAWSVAPTIAASPLYLMKLLLPATIGASTFLQFQRDEFVTGAGATQMLLFWNFGTGAQGGNPALNMSVTWEE